MINYRQFHDGRLEGFRIEGRNVHVYVATVEETRFDIAATGVVALSAGGFRAGNIILDVLVHECGEVTKQHIAELYDLLPGAVGEAQTETLLTKVHQETLLLLEINPSYGGHVLILTEAIDIVGPL